MPQSRRRRPSHRADDMIPCVSTAMARRPLKCYWPFAKNLGCGEAGASTSILGRPNRLLPSLVLRQHENRAWIASPDPALESYELRSTPGPDYSAEDETTLAPASPRRPARLPKRHRLRHPRQYREVQLRPPHHRQRPPHGHPPVLATPRPKNSCQSKRSQQSPRNRTRRYHIPRAYE